MFVIDPRLWRAGATHRAEFLAGTLAALDSRLKEMGGRLRVLNGDPAVVLPEITVGAETVYWNDDWTPYAQRRDALVASRVEVAVSRHSDQAIHPPGTLRTGAGQPYRVFTPFWRRWSNEPWDLPPTPGDARIGSDPGDGVPGNLGAHSAGEEAASARLFEFLEVIDRYDEWRDRPDIAGTSLLSADLKFGSIAPQRVRLTVGEHTSGREAFVRQLCWRDFYAQILAFNPDTTTRALRPEYQAVEWLDDPEGFAAWSSGQTGYPIVDAAMRQLARDGWIHNRLRMIAASFLVKDLLVDWRLGERWFRRSLIDGDLAQNVGNWQWAAGTGADAAPYFRVMNPTTQARRFDPDGAYVRSVIPELSGLSGASIHEPWKLGPLELEAAGVRLGDNYPEPIVDHRFARERLIAAFEEARSRA